MQKCKPYFDLTEAEQFVTKLASEDTKAKYRIDKIFTDKKGIEIGRYSVLAKGIAKSKQNIPKMAQI